MGSGEPEPRGKGGGGRPAVGRAARGEQVFAPTRCASDLLPPGFVPHVNPAARRGERKTRNARVMKSLTSLAAAAALFAGVAAHAAEPLQLDDAALDSVTAGRTFVVLAQNIGNFVQANSATNPLSASGALQASATALGERTVSSWGESLKLQAAATGSGAAVATNGIAAAGGVGVVSLAVFQNGGMIAKR